MFLFGLALGFLAGAPFGFFLSAFTHAIRSDA
jgi:hypothetical protein